MREGQIRHKFILQVLVTVWEIRNRLRRSQSIRKINGQLSHDMKPIKNQNTRSTLLTTFLLYNTILLTIDTMLYSRYLVLLIK